MKTYTPLAVVGLLNLARSGHALPLNIVVAVSSPAAASPPVNSDPGSFANGSSATSSAIAAAIPSVAADVSSAVAPFSAIDSAVSAAFSGGAEVVSDAPVAALRVRAPPSHAMPFSGPAGSSAADAAFPSASLVPHAANVVAVTSAVSDLATFLNHVSPMTTVKQTRPHVDAVDTTLSRLNRVGVKLTQADVNSISAVFMTLLDSVDQLDATGNFVSRPVAKNLKTLSSPLLHYAKVWGGNGSAQRLVAAISEL
ncbi:hypothetical protein R3P38DRAFT_3121930 [Favolaschia claudopus]|uniref:Uncharacterized protein n=1 Tax=Favolaschia claudopus TaxID=2862362 RepID=A0AAV9ZCX0_9AGAR